MLNNQGVDFLRKAGRQYFEQNNKEFAYVVQGTAVLQFSLLKMPLK
ncbi:24303_t:CDS:2 [Cetraspora pellucida]|uniref:24303_t:CDS:1 n=1 Tax=Cetraspora pellucida TaxID=1433469 RepID=A0A9N9B1C0_9GLOM|nr:24303_t:CDS:2 [Cetraspora pellucida]